MTDPADLHRQAILNELIRERQNVDSDDDDDDSPGDPDDDSDRDGNEENNIIENDAEEDEFQANIVDQISMKIL